MNRISDKRKKQNEEYRKAKKEMFLQDFKNGTLRCYFSGKPMRVPEENREDSDDELINLVTCHHISGERENEHLYDKENMVPVIGFYHRLYHDLPAKKLLKYPWYHKFLKKLKQDYPKIYEREIYKQKK